MKSVLSASIMCADPLSMRAELDLLAASEVKYFHCDVMDGHFVPNLMLSTETIRAVKRAYPQKPLDIHLMVEAPERMLDWFPFGEGDVVSIHYESTRHVHRALSMVREKGASAALALNPATPLECVREVLADIDMLLLMTVNPGFAAQKMVASALDKIKRARAMLDSLGFCEMPIEVDGNCSLANIPRMESAGASVFVAGSSSVFSAERGLTVGLRETLGCLARRA